MLARTLLSLALLLAPTTAALAGPNAGEEIDAFIERSGMRRQLADVGDQLASQILAGASLDESTRTLLAEAARREFALKKLIPDIRAGLLAKFDPVQTPAVNEWLEGDLGARVTAAEEAASSGDIQGRLQEYSQQLEANPPRPERVALVQQLDRAAGVTETNVEMALAIARASALAFNAASTTPHPESEIRDLIEQGARPQLEKAIPPVVLLSTLMTYEPISDADLEAYAAFAHSAPGRWYVTSARDAVVAAVERATERMAAEAAAKRAATPAQTEV